MVKARILMELAVDENNKRLVRLIHKSMFLRMINWDCVVRPLIDLVQKLIQTMQYPLQLQDIVYMIVLEVTVIEGIRKCLRTLLEKAGLLAVYCNISEGLADADPGDEDISVRQELAGHVNDIDKSIRNFIKKSIPNGGLG